MKDLQDSDSTGGLFSRRVSTPAIVAAMLRSLVLGASVVLSMAAGAQGADPNGDSDGDDVPNSGDFYPGTPGSSDNYGCPEDEEVVVVYGTRDSYSSVDCPDGTRVSYYTDCPTFGNWTTYNLAYHNEADSTYSGETTRVTVEEEEPASEDEEDEADYFDIDCDESGTACWTPGDWAGFCVGVNEYNSWADQMDWPPVDVPSQCTFYMDILLDDLEKKLAELAQEHPATTCATAVAIVSGATLVFAKSKGRAGGPVAAWGLISSTSVGCAGLMEINI